MKSDQTVWAELLQDFADMPDAVILTDEHLVLKRLNPVAERALGCTSTEATGCHLSKVVRQGTLPDQEGNTPRSAQRLERLGQLYFIRSQFRRSIRSAKGRQSLLAEACRSLVSAAGLKLAWIGWHMPETAALVIVAESGDSTGYLKDLQVFVDGRPNGQGASGTAFREDRPVVTADLLDDRNFQPWREKAQAAGLRSSAAFPLHIRGEVCGTLNVYADTTEFFQAEEIELLTDAATDLSVELDKLSQHDRRETAEAAARRERQFSDAMVESLPGVCYLYTEQGKFLRWNRHFETTTGYSAAEIAQMHPSDFFPADEHDLLKSRVERVFHDGEAVMEGTLLSKTGIRTRHFFTGRRVMFHGMSCLIGVGMDISELHLARAQLAESELRYRRTLDSILEACQVIDFDWRYTYLNDAAARQNRRRNDEMLGRRMQDVWPGIEETRAFALIKSCMDRRQPVHEEVEFQYPDGSAAWFDLRIQPVPEGIFLLSIDITEQHEAARRIQALNAELEEKIILRTQELKAAVERAEASDRTKSVFLATMSHELRTPLNSIIGFTGIMVKGLAGPLNPEQEKQLGMVQSSAKHLLALVNDVLDISKIEAGEMEVFVECFDARQSVRSVVSMMAGQAERKGLRLETRWLCGEVLLHSDKRRFEQILLNLINNAVKFTLNGGVTVEVDTTSLDQRPALTLRVRDTGIGIRAEDIGSLFQPFRQIDSGMTRQHDGTGLGLAICRRLLTYLGGTIEVDSEFGVGSTFTVTLPIEVGE